MDKYILILVLFVAGTQTVFSQTVEYTLKRGDQLSIEVMEHPEFNRSNILVLPDGSIQYPALGGIYVAELSSKQLADTIASKLKDTYVINPIVTVFVKHMNNQSINIFGKVNKPGRYQVFEPTELYSAISMAGGLKKISRSTKITIIRVDGTTTEFKMKRYINNEIEEIYLNKGDTIYAKSFEMDWAFLTFFVTLSNLIISVSRFS